jgi:hypothetical protein
VRVSRVALRRQGDRGHAPVVVEQQVKVETTGVAKEQKLMSKTYAIADLHGRFDLLEMALACIAERAEPPVTLITLGDYVDRGLDSRKIIERLMAGLGRDGWRLICLKGNHEDIMWQTCRRLPDVDWWLTNGGSATLISYGQQEGDQADVTVVPAPHLDWVERLPLIYPLLDTSLTLALDLRQPFRFSD